MFQLELYAPPIPVFLQCQLALQVTSPHILFLLLHRQLELLTGTYSLFGETLYL